MFRSFLRSKTFLALVVSLAAAGLATGGVDCDKSGTDQTAKVGKHCLIGKNITKTAELTDNGAVVTLEGKTEEAVGHIKEHLEVHAASSPCPECPLSMEGVTADVELTGKGGKVTVRAENAEAIKAVQEWAQKPAGSCCATKKQTA